jgi:tetratricopeptide (TPR) repeat protein
MSIFEAGMETTAETIPLPAPATMVSLPERRRASGTKVPAFFVLVLAFLLASFPARNSDVWLHLATGRALVEGNYQIGTEPFTYSETGSFWVNTSWLYDLVLYWFYVVLGTTALVVLKAILMVLLAGLLINTARPGKGSWLSLGTTALALVTIGPWMALKPICLSLLFLGFTIWFLERKTEKGSRGERATFFSYWPMLLLFAFWANLDAWFFLGPLTVALYFLGELLGGAVGPESGRAGIASTALSLPRKTWASLLAASLAVCLINPHHVRIFQVPFQTLFSEAATVLQQDPSLRQQFFAPLREVYFSGSMLHYPAGLAFWLLAMLTLVSFLLVFNGWPWRWGLTWAFFFVSSTGQTRLIPFFAVASAPILAGILAPLLDRPRPRWFPSTLGRLVRGLTFAGLLGISVAAWPGWIQGGSHGPRSWRVEIDQAVQQLGGQIARWQMDGKVPAAHVFGFSPESANYLAWACPRLKCFVNARLNLSEEGAAHFLAVRRGLLGRKSPAAPDRDWRAVLRDNQVHLLVIHASELGPAMDAMENLFPAFQECPLLLVRGRGAVFGWRDPVNSKKPDPYAGLMLDLKRDAFAADSRSTPGSSPGRDPTPMVWWDAFWRPRPAPSVDRDEATTFLTFFDASLELQNQRNLLLWQFKHSAELVAAASVGPAGLGCCVHLAPNAPLLASFRGGLDDGPAETLYLAVRAARRAVQENPDDAQAHFLLGESYHRLVKATRERSWAAVLKDIRTCQMLAAFHHAVRLKPGFAHAHERMAEFFQAMSYKDLALAHLRESYRHRLAASRAAARMPGESRVQAQKSLERLQKTIEALEKEVRTVQDRFLQSSSAKLRPLERATMAGNLGMFGMALDILLKSNIAAFGAGGLEMELQLLLHTGDVEKVKHWFNPEHHRLLGDSYYWIRAQMEAALGNYDEAVQALQEMSANRGSGGKGIGPPEQLALMLGNILLFEASGGPLKRFPAPTVSNFADKDLLSIQVSQVLDLMDKEAHSLVLQGALALEAGRNQRAAAYFRRALAFWSTPAGATFAAPQSQTGRRMARFFLNLLEDPPLANRPPQANP